MLVDSKIHQNPTLLIATGRAANVTLYQKLNTTSTFTFTVRNQTIYNTLSQKNWTLNYSNSLSRLVDRFELICLLAQSLLFYRSRVSLLAHSCALVTLVVDFFLFHWLANSGQQWTYNLCRTKLKEKIDNNGITNEDDIQTAWQKIKHNTLQAVKYAFSKIESCANK